MSEHDERISRLIDWSTTGYLTASERDELERERQQRFPDPDTTMPVPRGYVGVEHADGVVHAIDLDDLHDDRPLWREPPVCGRATGVSSDEGGHAALHRRTITCLDCVSILA
jgi:hypothetical protein